MRKKKVLFVVHHLTIGGVQKSLVSALDAIDYEQNDVTLYLRKDRTDILSLINKNVNIIINKDSTHYYRTAVAFYLQFRILLCKLFSNLKKREKLEASLSEYVRNRMMKKESKTFFVNTKYDIAISYAEGYEALFVDQYIQAEEKIVFYQTSEDHMHELHELVFPHYNKIVVEHDNIKQLLANWYPKIAEKLYVLENYVDCQKIKEQSKAYSIDAERKIILCTCGRIAKVKGFDLAAEAAAILRSNEVPFKWYFVGDGPEKKIVKSIIEQNELTSFVILTGMKKNPYPYIAGCDIFVQPSYEEAISMVALEAQILCKPVVTTKTAGGMSLVQDGITGIQTEINAQALALGILQLIENPDLLHRMQANLQNIDHSADYARYRNDWLKLLGEK